MHSLSSASRHFLVALVLASSARADLVLETETAELGRRGESNFSQAIQQDWDKDGSRTTSTVTQYEYAITDRAEILIEPFFYEWDHVKGEKNYAGVGDLEITPSYMFHLDDEKSWLPAAVLAFKLKVPTATNDNIGSGEFDYQPYFIFGKKLGNWVHNFNVDYNFVTSPSKDDKLKNQLIFDYSIEYQFSEKFSVFVEGFTNTSPSKGENGTIAGAVAAEYKFSDHFNALLSIGYDSGHTLSIRPGFNIPF